MEGEVRRRALVLLDRHVAGAAINPGAWRKPRTSPKRRLARGQPPTTRIEELSMVLYNLPPVPHEYSDRGKARRAKKWPELKPQEPKYMHAHARARRRFFAALEERLAA